MIGQIVDRLIDEARRIWCYRWLVAGVTATLLIAAVVFTFSAPSTYEAWGQLYVSHQTTLSAAAEGVSLADLGPSSTYVVQKTLFNDDNLEAIARALEPNRHLTKFQLGAATAALRKGVRLVDGGDGFVEVHYTDTDPRRAQVVVGLILNRFMRGSYERSQRELRLAGAFLDQQIAYYDDQISQSQAKIAALRRRWGVTAYDAGEDTVIAAVQPQARTPAGPIQLAAASLPTPPPHTEAGDRVNQLEAKLVTLLTVDTEQHPDVITTRRQLEQARIDNQREAAAIPASPRTMVPPASTPAPAAPIRRMLVRRRAPAPPPEAAAELADLQRKDDLLNASYQQLVAKRAAAQMSEAVSGADRSKFLITRQPTLPTTPVGPNRKLYLAAGLLVALGGGLGAGYLRAVTRGIMVSPREVEEVFQLPVIGTVSWEPAWRTQTPFSAIFGPADPPARRRRRLRIGVPIGKAS